MSLIKPIHVEPRAKHRLFVRFADGVEGEIDLSDLAGRGVFSLWDQPGAFDRVEIGDDGSIRWSDDVELCADAIYMKLTGQNANQAFASRRASIDA